MKNTSARRIQNRTFRRNSPETDRRVRRTKQSLHDALIGLSHNHPYDSIAVHDILERADVGRSTFYSHFRDKGDLLESSIEALIRSLPCGDQHSNPVERIIAFSRPLLDHIDGVRRTRQPGMPPGSRDALHDHLQAVLETVIADKLDGITLRHSTAAPSELIARHVASTFVLVLDAPAVDTRKHPLLSQPLDSVRRALARILGAWLHYIADLLEHIDEQVFIK